MSGLRNASVGIATVTQESFKSQYYVTRAPFCFWSLFAMTASLHVSWINNAILKKKSLLIVYRCFLGINPEQGSKKRRGGINPNVSTLQRKLVDFEWSL